MNSAQPFKVSFEDIMKLIQFRKESSGYCSDSREFSFPMVEPIESSARPRILVIAPHQDDEILGCGGVISAYAHNGCEVKIVYMTDGSQGGSEESTGPELVAQRRTEAREGLLELGYCETVFLDHPDAGLRCSSEAVVEILNILNEYRPDKVFVPFFFEMHPDHIAAAEIFAHAILWYEHPLECYNYEVWTPLIPNVLVDVTQMMDAKLNALSKHRSQIMMIDYIDKIRGLNAYRSITAGRQSKFCEAFLKCTGKEYTAMAKDLGIYNYGPLRRRMEY